MPSFIHSCIYSSIHSIEFHPGIAFNFQLSSHLKNENGALPASSAHNGHKGGFPLLGKPAFKQQETNRFRQGTLLEFCIYFFNFDPCFSSEKPEEDEEASDKHTFCQRQQKILED